MSVSVYLYVCRHAHSFHTYRYRYLTSYVAVYPAAQALYTINLNREHISKTRCLNSTKFSTHNQQVCVHLATYACPPPHAAAAAIDRYVLPTGPTAANPPHAIYCRGRMRHTDGRTPYRFIDPPHIIRAVPITVMNTYTT